MRLRPDFLSVRSGTRIEIQPRLIVEHFPKAEEIDKLYQEGYAAGDVL
jgi:hypothetical protein